MARAVRSRTVRAWPRVFALWLAAGCSGVERAEMSIASVEPNRVSSRTDTDVVVHGLHFDDVVAPLDLASTDAPRVARKWSVSIEDTEHHRAARRLDATRLRFTVPAGLEPGTYALAITNPSGATARLTRALTVSDAPIDDLSVRIETRPDGEGEVVADRELAAGEALALHAVVRTAAGAVVSGDYEFSWRAEGLSGALREATATQATFASASAGSAVVIAEHPELGEARTGRLVVRALEATTLSIEDAPGGRGKPFDQPRTLTTDDAASFYAVTLDRFGNFVSDVEVRWSVSGEVGPARSREGGLSLEPNRPGTARVKAERDGQTAETAELIVRPGRAAELAVVPDRLTLDADDDPVRFTVSARDADGNETSNLGDITWSVAAGPITALDPATGELDPRAAGSGSVRASSSHGPTAQTGAITIEPGRASRLAIEPNTLTLSADDAPVQFQTTAFDADGNRTDTGTLFYSTVGGSIGALNLSSGKLDPKVAGSAKIRVVSTRGASGQTETITIHPGRAASLSIAPHTLNLQVGDAPTTFSASALDADGNATLDLGSLDFSIASGSFGALDAASGTLTPTTAGQGVVRVTSSYGPAADSGAVIVRPIGPPVAITNVSAPAQLSRGQGLARFEVTVANNSPTEAARVSSLRLDFVRGGVSANAEYGVFTDTRNPHRVAPNSSAKFVYYVSASGSAVTGTVQVAAYLDAFVSGYGEILDDETRSFAMLGTTAPTANVTRPTPTEERVCAGNPVPFDGRSSTGFGLAYSWSFESAMPAASTAEAPSGIRYTAAPGRHLFALTVTDWNGDSDTAYGSVFVGRTESTPSETFPTGRVTFAQPSAGGTIDLTALPADDALRLSASSSSDLRQCNGMPVAPTGKRFLTVWSDRGTIDPAADIRPELAGIQVALAASGTYFDRVDLLPDSPALEGEAMVYAEYYNPTLGAVTAAGFQTFQMDNDLQAPSIVASRPASDCGDCYSIGSPWVFQFSEPMSVSSLANVAVYYKSAQSCAAAGFSDVTGSSVRIYDTAARTLTVRPPVFSGPYTLRVVMNGVRDASSNANPLPSFVRCVQVAAAGDAPEPATPSVIGVSADPFSPDGDGLADQTVLTGRVDAETRIARLQITRGSANVRTLLAFVTGASDPTFSWDGRDYTGRMVPDGVYRYALSAENIEGEASAPFVGSIEVDSAVHFIAVPFRYY